MFMSEHLRDRHPGNPVFMAGLKGIIFDCDGVLFDSLASNVTYYNAIRTRLGLGPMNRDEEQYVHSHTVDQSLAYIVPEELWPELAAAREEVDYRKDILPHLAPEPGLFEMLGWLRSQDVRLGISTNRTTTMDMVTERFEFDLYFSPIMHAGIVAGKPDPQGLKHIMQRWDAGPDEVAFIGDTWIDEETARRAGVAFWAYRSPRLNACLHIRSYWQLRLWLGTWLEGRGWGVFHYRLGNGRSRM